MLPLFAGMKSLWDHTAMSYLFSCVRNLEHLTKNTVFVKLHRGKLFLGLRPGHLQILTFLTRIKESQQLIKAQRPGSA